MAMPFVAATARDASRQRVASQGLAPALLTAHAPASIQRFTVRHEIMPLQRNRPCPFDNDSWYAAGADAFRRVV